MIELQKENEPIKIGLPKDQAIEFADRATHSLDKAIDKLDADGDFEAVLYLRLLLRALRFKPEQIALVSSPS